MDDERLSDFGARRYYADRNPGFPDRIEMRDAEIGETVLLLNHVHQTGDTPYRASHAIFVREGADACYDRVGEVPQALRPRLLSLRAFRRLTHDGRRRRNRGRRGGGSHRTSVRKYRKLAYIQAHYAKRGCFAGTNRPRVAQFASIDCEPRRERRPAGTAGTRPASAATPDASCAEGRRTRPRPAFVRSPRTVSLRRKLAVATGQLRPGSARRKPARDRRSE